VKQINKVIAVKPGVARFFGLNCILTPLGVFFLEKISLFKEEKLMKKKNTKRIY